MTNIAELLKDCPKGTKLYSPLFGEVEFAEVMSTDYVPIRVMKRGLGIRFDEYGRYLGNEYPDSECLLFPSKEVRTWEGWKLPIVPKYKVGDNIEATIYGIKRRVTIREVDKTYLCYFGTLEECIGFSEQDQWHLAPKPHYDIANFKPFDKVLVRCSNDEEWMIEFFCKYDTLVHTAPHRDYPFMGIGDSYSQCIPYEGNEHLLGTTNPCDEQYINW